MTGGGAATLRFPGLEESPSTTCVGHLTVTPQGIALSRLICHGPSAVATRSFATPVTAKLSGGCLQLPDDTHFESRPGACSSAASAPTLTFGSVSGG